MFLAFRMLRWSDPAPIGQRIKRSGLSAASVALLRLRPRRACRPSRSDCRREVRIRQRARATGGVAAHSGLCLQPLAASHGSTQDGSRSPKPSRQQPVRAAATAPRISSTVTRPSMFLSNALHSLMGREPSANCMPNRISSTVTIESELQSPSQISWVAVTVGVAVGSGGPVIVADGAGVKGVAVRLGVGVRFRHSTETRRSPIRTSNE